MDLATATRRAAASRTWVTDPGDASSAATRSVCIESITATAGRSSASVETMVSTVVSSSTISDGGTEPSRAARAATCDGASSPVTSRTPAPVDATEHAICSVRVDLPTPGSPLNNVTEPATRPPPRTRSTSTRPTGFGTEVEPSNPARGSTARAAIVDRGRACMTSSIVAHPSQEVHCPIHAGVSAPHDRHTKIRRCLAMRWIMTTGCDSLLGLSRR